MSTHYAVRPRPGDNKPPKGIRRGAEDLINVPATALPSFYVPAKAAVKAAQGDTREAKKYIKDVKDTSVVYNLATGNVKKAGKLAEEHPGFAALEVAGAKGTLGRAGSRAVPCTRTRPHSRAGRG